ncbi:hypothetical protein [Ezakiella coagulans]|uniref:hypothetical protein n=1 Tax=Ezakiella coagulans TaxID=46507 RepID=UPI0028893417|nr:hypothetical protein [Ezakiella coagulans]
MKKISKKELEENYRARIESERPNIYASEEERIATEKIIAERQKKIEEYGRKMYGKDYIEKKHTK